MSAVGLKQASLQDSPHRVPAALHASLDTAVDLKALARQTAGVQDKLRSSMDACFPPRATGDTGLDQRINDPGFLEVFPRTTGSRPPRLLTELETLITERSRAAQRLACPTRPGMPPPKRASGAYIENLALECHRTAFDQFIAAFGAYGPLLARMKAEFENTVNAGIRCAWQNLALRQQLLELLAERKRAAAATSIEQSVGERAWRHQMQQRIDEAKEKLARAEKRATFAERHLQDTRGEREEVQRQLEALRASNTWLRQAVEEDQQWQATSDAAMLTSISIGPLSPEEEAALLEAESNIVVPPERGMREANLEAALSIGDLDTLPAPSSSTLHAEDTVAHDNDAAAPVAAAGIEGRGMRGSGSGMERGLEAMESVPDGVIGDGAGMVVATRATWEVREADEHAAADGGEGSGADAGAG